MRLFKLCNCVIEIGNVGWGMCVVVQWFVADVAVRTCCIASRVVGVRASLTILVGRVRVIAVLSGETATLGLLLSRGGAMYCTGGGELREGCSCWGRIGVCDVCISLHRCAKVF